MLSTSCWNGPIERGSVSERRRFGSARGVAHGQVHRAAAAADDSGHPRSDIPDLFAGVRPTGDPGRGRCGERPCPPSYVAAFSEEYNLDKPWWSSTCSTWAMCCRVIWAKLLRQHASPHELAIRYPTTIKLAVMAIIIEIVIGISAGDARRHSAGKVRRQPGHGQHAARHLHPRLRHRQFGPAHLRGPAGLVPGHRDPRAPPTS